MDNVNNFLNKIIEQFRSFLVCFSGKTCDMMNKFLLSEFNIPNRKRKLSTRCRNEYLDFDFEEVSTNDE